MINCSWLIDADHGSRRHRFPLGRRRVAACIVGVVGLGLTVACSEPAEPWATTPPGSQNSADATNAPGAPGMMPTAPQGGTGVPNDSVGAPGAPNVTPTTSSGVNPDGMGSGLASDLRTIPIKNAPYRVLSRLTGRQYVNAAGLLLGIDALPFLPLIPEIAPNAGYSNAGFAQSQPYDLILAFDAAAKAMTDSAVDWSALAARYGGCAELTCVSQFISSFGESAYRRPLSAEEVEAYRPVLDAAAANELSFTDTLALVVRAILQSPEFLYLFEGDPLTDYQLAARLSFFVTDGPPDEELLADARSGSLRTPDRLTYHVDRLLTAHGSGFARAFAYDYLGLRKAFQRTVDVDRATIEALVSSAEETFAALIAADAPIGAILTTRSFVTNPITATYLGANEALTTVEAEASNGFMGLVTHPATLIAMSNAFEGSMVSRGQFLAHQMLCIPPTPPPSTAFNPDDVAGELPPDPTQRDEAEARLQDPSCLGCHVQFEPYAFALNKWAGDGRYYDDPRLQDSGPITTSLGTFTFSGFEDFLPLVASSDQFNRCMVDHFVRYGLRHTSYPADVIDAVLQSAGADAGSITFGNLIRAVVQQPVFSSQ